MYDIILPPEYTSVSRLTVNPRPYGAHCDPATVIAGGSLT